MEINLKLAVIIGVKKKIILKNGVRVQIYAVSPLFVLKQKQFIPLWKLPR
jgi:hypothetical protein